MKTFSEFLIENDEHYDEAEQHLSKANDADAKGDKLAFHHHMADHHDSMSQWHESKGRSAAADKHAEKADYHSDKYTQHARGVKEEAEQLDELSKKTVRSYANKKQAELDDVPPMPFKKPAKSKAETEKAAKGMMGALARLSGRKPTSESVAEEAEQIDELRTSTLLRYQTKANKALIGGDRNKEEKRIKGIQTANYKIQSRHKVKEEAEQIDELSVNKMLKYSDAAEKDRQRLNAKWDAGTASRKEQEKAIGREEGENRATNKIKKKTGKYPWQLNREETEQLDEISQKLKQSYLDQSRDQVSQLKKHIKGEYSGIVKRMIARRKKGIALASK